VIQVNIFNNIVDADLLNYGNIPGVYYYRLYSNLDSYEEGVDFGETDVLYEAGNSTVGYNYFLGGVDRKTGRFVGRINWISKERIVFET
jgi:hypothetical protein